MPSFCWVEWAPRLFSSVLQTKIKVSGDREILPPTVSPVVHHLLQASLTSLRAASQQPPAVGVAFSDPLVAGASPLLHGASLLSVDPPLRTSPTVSWKHSSFPVLLSSLFSFLKSPENSTLKKQNL